MPAGTAHAPRTDDPCTSVQLPFDLSSASTARRMFASELLEHGLTRSVVDDATLVLSELVSNSLEHGAPNHRGLLEVSWCVEDERLRISVHDGGPPTLLSPQQFSDVNLRGRGLIIVDHLCDSWHVDHDEGLRVTAELHFGAEAKIPQNA
jgi:anti-sigma regulatory factor (Ser/Thr protein kinase)